MDNTRRVRVAKAKQVQERHQLLSASASSSGRRSRCCSPTNSPEFEFWMVRNPSFPQPNLLSADQLFVDGVLLPLHLLQPNNNNNNHPHHHHSHSPDPQPDTRSSLPDPRPDIPPSASVTAAEPTTSLTSSKRWTDIFRKSEKKAAAASNKNQEDNKDREKKMKKEEKKKRKREKKGGHTRSRGSSSAELNIIINIWPFSRSRSAGNSGSRPRMFPGAPGTRRSSSAPCSRSNSAGESKSRKWPGSPGRPGVHVGRGSPVWQARRNSNWGRSGGSSGCNSVKSNNFYQLVAQSGESGASKKEVTEPCRSKSNSSSSSSSGRGSNNNNNNNSNNNDGGGSTNSKAKVLNLKVPTMCIGYRNHLSCRRDENGGFTGAAVGGSNRGVKNGNRYNLGNGGNGNIFNFFTKKVY